MTSVLSIRGLELSRPQGQILRGIDLELRDRERVAILGASGAGKTTVLRTIVALERFDRGAIELDGVKLTPGPVPRESMLRELRRRVGIVFQDHSLFEHLTAIENVTLAPIYALQVPPAEAQRRGMELLDSLGVAPRASAYPRALSGGEAQRVAIARALAVGPPLLLMDEPTAALDPDRRNSLGDLLRQLTARGTTVLIATHDLEFAGAFASRTLKLIEGRLSD